MEIRKVLSVSIGLAVVLLVALTASIAFAENKSEQGTTTYLITLVEKADLSLAYSMADWELRGEFVLERLQEVARRSQAGIIDELTSEGVPFTSLYIANVLFVTGDQALATRLEDRPEVAGVYPEQVYQLPEPEPELAGPGIDAVEGNILQIQANQVWTDLGVLGEGIVVGNIDTGVRYTHEALVNQYRGNFGGGSFDHNYNWWDPTAVCPAGEPCDNNDHGTHTMGTMVGGDGPGPFANDIGVAPGAKWIAAKGCETSSCSQSALLSSAQFMLAPTRLDGTVPDPARRPHVVNNSWGGTGGNPFYQDAV